MDIIFVNELRLDLLIGVYDWERRVPQSVRIDLEIGLPGAQRAGSDRLEDTVDYAVVVGRIEEHLRSHPCSLLETAAERIAELVMREFASPWVKVSVAKLAPLRNVKQLGVVIERGARS